VNVNKSVSYEFDVAVSFAGEDREFVEAVVSGLKDGGLRVFYDSDYFSDIWGEDLIEYLDTVYRVKARFAVLFISRFYAEKMWTRHERRSALARALEQSTAYVLPIRLDSSSLPGLQPTIGYLDARRVGMDGIVQATLAKVAGSTRAIAPTIDRVPRTEIERQQVLLERPHGWEALYLAGQLLHEKNAAEPKYRDHVMRYAPLTGEHLDDDDVLTFSSRRLDDIQRLNSNLMRILSNETQDRAFGAPEGGGDPEFIGHLAMRWNQMYEAFMDLAARIRGVSVGSESYDLLELEAQLVDEPIADYRHLVDAYVSQCDAISSRLAKGETIKLYLNYTLRISDELMTSYFAELNRLYADTADGQDA